MVCIVLYYNLYCILRLVGKRELGRVTYCVQAADWKPGLRTAGAACGGYHGGVEGTMVGSIVAALTYLFQEWVTS